MQGVISGNIVNATHNLSDLKGLSLMHISFVSSEIYEHFQRQHKKCPLNLNVFQK